MPTVPLSSIDSLPDCAVNQERRVAYSGEERLHLRLLSSAICIHWAWLSRSCSRDSTAGNACPSFPHVFKQIRACSHSSRISSATSEQPAHFSLFRQAVYIRGQRVSTMDTPSSIVHGLEISRPCSSNLKRNSSRTDSALPPEGGVEVGLKSSSRGLYIVDAYGALLSSRPLPGG